MDRGPLVYLHISCVVCLLFFSVHASCPLGLIAPIPLFGISNTAELIRSTYLDDWSQKLALAVRE